MDALPFSDYRRFERFVFLAGQVGQVGGRLVEGLTAQTQQAIINAATILKREGLSLEDVIDVTAFLVDPSHYDEFNTAYSAGFPAPFPTRTCVVVQALPMNALIELKIIAAID